MSNHKEIEKLVLYDARRTNESAGHVYSGWAPRESNVTGWLIVIAAVVALAAGGIAGQMQAEHERPAVSYIVR